MSPEKIISPEAMMDSGARYAAGAKSGDVFALVGDLGAGKTHWSKGFIQAISTDSLVASPTFSIVNEYPDGSLPVFHFDFYRLKSEQELINLGWDEYLDQSAIIICEWADLFPDLFPEITRWIQITHESDGSRIVSEMDRTPTSLVKGDP